MRPIRPETTRIFPVGVALLAVVFLAGCLGYQLGSMLPDDIKSVHVPTFVNRTDEPRLEVETTAATINEIQRDGSLIVADAKSADAVLYVELTDFNLNPVAYSKSSSKTPNNYRMTITAKLRMVRRTNDAVVVEARGVKGDTVFSVVGDLSSSKRYGMPLASTDLGDQIVQKIVEAW